MPTRDELIHLDVRRAGRRPARRSEIVKHDVEQHGKGPATIGAMGW